MKFISSQILPVLLCLLAISSLAAQVNYTANDINPPYEGGFRAGVNPGYHGSNWRSSTLGILAAGNPAANVPGVGVRAIRGTLPEGIANQYSYGNWTPTYDFYHALGLEDNTVFVGFASDESRDPEEYCDGIETDMFANLYEPIWDGGANGTPINENNYYALYLYNVINAIGHRVKFWEIWNEPGFDFSGAKGWLPPGAPGNWWENVPDPCDYKLRAPVYHYIRTLRISYEVIKTMSPDDFVVMSGIGYNSFLDVILRHTDNPDQGKVTSEFPLKGGAYFDVAGFHAYPHIDGSTRYWDNDLGGFVYTRHSDAAIEGLLETQQERADILASYGYDGLTYPKKKWTVTEINVPRQAFGQYFGSEELQVNYLSKLIISAMQNEIVQTHIFDMAEKEYFDEQEDAFDAMGLYEKLEDILPFQQVVTDGGISYKTTSDFLFGTTYDDNKTNAMNLPDNLGGGAFRKPNGDFVYTLWAKTQTDQSENANRNYSFPSSFGVNNLIKYEWDFSQTKSTSTINRSNISLDATPIFLIPNINSPEGVLTLNCTSGYEIDNATATQSGIVVEWELPTATTTCPAGNVTWTQIEGLPSGSLFPPGPTVIHYVAEDACGNREECALFVNVAATGGGLGDCNYYRFDFNWRGTYEGNKYFISKFDTTYQAALDIAAGHGGHLVSIGDAAENAFLEKEIKDIAFIGLNDIQNEGSLRWPDNTPVNYTNFDDCAFCTNNSTSVNQVIFHPWNGRWSWTNTNIERFFIMELPCSEEPTGCTDNDNDGVCANEDCNDLNPNLPATPGSTCNDNNPNTANDVIQADGCSCVGTEIPVPDDCPVYVIGEGKITVNGITNPARTKIRLWRTEGGWVKVYECAFNCSSTVVIDNLAGPYRLKIDVYTNDWNDLCEVDDDVLVTGDIIGCTDNDNDGVCAVDDCNDNNPGLPANPGTACNDNNEFTTNDVILADGCSCAGTPPITNECATVTAGPGSLTIIGSQPNQIIKIFDANWDFVYQCSDGECPNPLIINDLSAQTYNVSVTQYDANWGYVCKVKEKISVGGGFAVNEIATPVKGDLRVFPNPSTGLFTLITKSPAQQLTVIDARGQLVKQQSMQAVAFEKVDLDIREFAGGLYLLLVDYGDGKVLTKRLIIQE